MPLETLQLEVLITLPFDKFIRSRTHGSALGKRLGSYLLKMLLGDDGEKDHTFEEQGEGGTLNCAPSADAVAGNGLIRDQMDRMRIDDLDFFDGPNIAVLR
jgi:hypothetical protein